MGFIIGALVIVLYVLLITKAIYVAKTAKDDERTDILQLALREYWHFI